MMDITNEERIERERERATVTRKELDERLETLVRISSHAEECRKLHARIDELVRAGNYYENKNLSARIDELARRMTGDMQRQVARIESIETWRKNLSVANSFADKCSTQADELEALRSELQRCQLKAIGRERELKARAEKAEADCMTHKQTIDDMRSGAIRSASEVITLREEIVALREKLASLRLELARTHNDEARMSRIWSRHCQ